MMQSVRDYVSDAPDRRSNQRLINNMFSGMYHRNNISALKLNSTEVSKLIAYLTTRYSER